MNLPVTQRHFLSFSRKLFLSVISLFLVFAVCFIAYQYQREREYKVELLNTKLQDYNSRLYERLDEQPLDNGIIIFWKTCALRLSTWMGMWFTTVIRTTTSRWKTI